MIQYEPTDHSTTVTTSGSECHHHCTTCICTDSGLKSIITSTGYNKFEDSILYKKERAAFFKKIYNFISQEITFKQGLNLKSNYKNPKNVNRKANTMKGRNKPCRRVAIINQ